MAETEPGERRAAGTERGTGPGTEPNTGPGTQPGSEPVTQPGTAEGPQRPPYSYVALITMAIRASPEQRLPLSGIYAFIAERFPFYRGPGRRWQNSVRHSLSLSPCFRRLPGSHGRAGQWALHPDFQDMFPDGDYRSRRRSRRPPASPPPPSGIPPSPAAPGASPSFGVPPGFPEFWPGPAAPCPPVLLGAVPPVPLGCPQGPWAALVLPRGYPELPARCPPVPPGPPLPAWALLPAGPHTAVPRDHGLCPAFR